MVLGGRRRKNGRRVGEKNMGANFNNAPAGNIIIPREFFNLVFGQTHGGFRVCPLYISLPNPTTQRRDIKKSERHGFLYLRMTVNPRGFHLISSMKFDESKDET